MNKKSSQIGALAAFGHVIGKMLSVLFMIALTVLLIALITGTVVGCTFIYYIKTYINTEMDEFSTLAAAMTSTSTTKIYYMDWVDRENNIGTPVEIEDQRLHGAENQIWVSYDELPKNLINAFVTMEDKRFWEHNGVDFITTAKATINYLTGKGSAGGSTLTQQLIKNVTGDDDVSPQRKIQEILRAFEVESMYSKEQILEMYLNIIYLSHGCYGVQAASNRYFNKDVSELTLEECATIAAITQYPTKWDPIWNPENNKQRRDDILTEMANQGYISVEECRAAKAKPVVTYEGGGNADDSYTNQIYSWYTEAAIDQAMDLLMAAGYSESTASVMIYNSGLQIITAMDPEIQEIMESYYENEDNFVRVDNSPIQPNSSMVVMDPYTGDVVGLVGSRGQKTLNRALNYATDTTRSPGSSIKPLAVYAPALEYGLINYNTVVDDTPFNFGEEEIDPDTGETTYSRSGGWPSNYSNRYSGLTTIAEALRSSLNTVSVKVLDELTLERSFDFVKNKLHIDNFIESMTLANGNVLTDKDYSALALGGMNYGVNVLEMTAAYQIFVNDGVYTSPRIVLQILDSEGKLIVDNTQKSEIVLSTQNAYIMTKLLQNVVKSGTATAITLDEKIEVAGKTGTTTNDYDRWFCGYTPYYVASVWFGYNMPQSLENFSASVSPAVTIWDDIMTQIHDRLIERVAESGETLKTFSRASGVVTATVCRDSGKLMTDACRADPRGSRATTGYYTLSTVPTDYCDVHVLVDYDTVSGGIACIDCPSSNIVKFGLLNVTRTFPVQVYITDAEYVWQDIGTAEPAREETLPFYASVLPDGLYCGISRSAKQFNRICTEHYAASTDYEDETGSAQGDIDMKDPFSDLYEDDWYD